MTKKKKKSYAELEAEVKFLRESKKAEGTILVINNFIKWASLTIIAWFAYASISVLAGKTTSAIFRASFMTNFLSTDNWCKPAIILVVLLCIAVVLYGKVQRYLRQNTIERLESRIRDLETRIDPNRSSSMLTPRGETRKEDL